MIAEVTEPCGEPYLEGLNEQQLEAVCEENGAILVVAGAGSGKTKVLTSRIVRLVNQGVSPYEIMAVTFTNKAASEMRERLSEYLGEETVKRMWVGTFHKICGIILRKDLQKYKTKDGRSWDNKFVIYDDSDTKAIIKAAVKKLDLDEKIYDYKLIKTIISNAKNDMKDAHAFATYAKDYKAERISEVYYEYEKQLSINNALDFDDMLLLCAQLLEQHADVREYYSERFKHILVDEFQDTNTAQYKLIRMLFNDKKAQRDDVSLCAVGDVDQSIYSWRGADFRIILNFQKDYPNTKVIKLEQNYRSSSNILNAANAVIENNSQRLEKNLFSQKGHGEKITLYSALDDRDEALYIANKIQDLRNYSDVAVLYRTNAQSRSIERALYEAALPYKVVGGVKFYERKEIKDIVAYLRVIYNPNDSQSLKRIINTPKRAIGDATVKNLEQLADKHGMSIFEVIKEIANSNDENTENETGDISSDISSQIKTRVKTQLTSFANLIDDFIMKQQSLSLSEFTSYVLEYSGYLAELRGLGDSENEDRIENLQEFVNVAREFEYEDYAFDIDFEEDLGILGNFLAQIALVSETDKTEDMQNSVTLMTLHAAKGLEFPTVFLAGLEENIFPHSRSLSYEAKSSDLEEERRLMYVGITRAMEILYLTHAKQRMVWGDIKCFPISRFVDEIPEKLLVKTGDTEEKAHSEVYYTPQQPPKRNRMGSSLPKKSAGSYIKGDGSTNLSNNLAASLGSHKSHRVVKKADQKPQAESAATKKESSIRDLIAKCKASAKSPQTSTSAPTGMYGIGTRVFHQQFGVGHIKEADKDSYVVEFSKSGTKTLDAFSSNLKTF